LAFIIVRRPDSTAPVRRKRCCQSTSRLVDIEIEQRCLALQRRLMMEIFGSAVLWKFHCGSDNRNCDTCTASRSSPASACRNCIGRRVLQYLAHVAYAGDRLAAHVKNDIKEAEAVPLQDHLDRRQSR
jgi:hypothetical protein